MYDLKSSKKLLISESICNYFKLYRVLVFVSKYMPIHFNLFVLLLFYSVSKILSLFFLLQLFNFKFLNFHLAYFKP